MTSILAKRLRAHARRLRDEGRDEQMAADLCVAAAVVESDYDRAPTASQSADLAIARRSGVGLALRAFCDAVEMGGVSASRLAEMLRYSVADLHGDGLQRAANATFEAARWCEAEDRLGGGK